MAKWLFKSEPDVWGWNAQVAKGDAGEEWGGVRNYQARNNMRAMGGVVSRSTRASSPRVTEHQLESKTCQEEIPWDRL